MPSSSLVEVEVEVEVGVDVEVGVEVEVDATLSFSHSLDGVQIFFGGVVGWVPHYAIGCRISTLIMVPINFWRNSDLFTLVYLNLFFQIQYLGCIAH